MARCGFQFLSLRAQSPTETPSPQPPKRPLDPGSWSTYYNTVPIVGPTVFYGTVGYPRPQAPGPGPGHYPLPHYLEIKYIYIALERVFPIMYDTLLSILTVSNSHISFISAKEQITIVGL